MAEDSAYTYEGVDVAEVARRIKGHRGHAFGAPYEILQHLVVTVLRLANEYPLDASRPPAGDEVVTFDALGKRFGPLTVYMATHDDSGKELPKNQQHPFISDGCFGELYEGDADGARELAAYCLAAADAYDSLMDDLTKAPLGDEMGLYRHPPVDPVTGEVSAADDAVSMGRMRHCDVPPPHRKEGCENVMDDHAWIDNGIENGDGTYGITVCPEAVIDI